MKSGKGERMSFAKRTTLVAAATLILPGLGGCTIESEAPAMARKDQIPAEYARGEELFNAKCAECHGEGGRGTDKGPPFLHRVYHPGHHGDKSFHMAVQRGAIAHHWQFGDMPKVEGLNKSDVDEIIAYVRWLQRRAGIY